MADRDTIRQIIADELARPEIQRELTDRVSQSLTARVGEAMRHPLSIKIAGFILTFFVGTTIERNLAESARAADERAELVLRAKENEAEAAEVIKDLVALVYGRAIEASLLRSAIKRQSSSEILDRKFAYDTAYRAWNKREPEYRWALRQAWADGDAELLEEESPYERAVTKYIDRYFAEADKCQTRQFDLNIQAILPDQPHANQAANSCGSANWSGYVSRMTSGARKCASYIQTIGLSLLRRKTEARIAAYLKGQSFSASSVTDADAIDAQFEAACSLDG